MLGCQKNPVKERSILIKEFTRDAAIHACDVMFEYIRGQGACTACPTPFTGKSILILTLTLICLCVAGGEAVCAPERHASLMLGLILWSCPAPCAGL